MTEEKAIEIGKKYKTPCHGTGDCEFEARQAALEMAKWKDEQFQKVLDYCRIAYGVFVFGERNDFINQIKEIYYKQNEK